MKEAHGNGIDDDDRKRTEAHEHANATEILNEQRNKLRCVGILVVTIKIKQTKRVSHVAVVVMLLVTRLAWLWW